MRTLAALILCLTSTASAATYELTGTIRSEAILEFEGRQFTMIAELDELQERPGPLNLHQYSSPTGFAYDVRVSSGPRAGLLLVRGGGHHVGQVTSTGLMHRPDEYLAVVFTGDNPEQGILDPWQLDGWDHVRVYFNTFSTAPYHGKVESIVQIPEPSSLILLLIGLAVMRWPR